MRDTIERVCKEIDSMHTASKKIIKYGSWSFLLLLFISLVISVLNRHWFGNINEIANNSIYLFKTSFSVFAITMIGGLVLDYISKKG